VRIPKRPSNISENTRRESVLWFMEHRVRASSSPAHRITGPSRSKMVWRPHAWRCFSNGSNIE
jgi:hypothetical protein